MQNTNFFRNDNISFLETQIDQNIKEGVPQISLAAIQRAERRFAKLQKERNELRMLISKVINLD